MSYRSNLEVYASILDAASDATAKTKIMNLCNLSFASLEDHLCQLKNAQLIIENRKTFQITEKGLYFLELFEQLKAMHLFKSMDRWG